MAINNDPKLRRKTRRIYYGPPGDTDLYWNVKVRPALKSVIINGSLEHAISGFKGSTIGCHLSNCASAKANASAFPHPVLMAVFTRQTCIIVTKVKNGVPSDGVEYYHDYTDLVMLNDTDEFKKAVKANPDLAERSFTLRPPPRVKTSGPSGKSKNKASTGVKKAFAERGALKRAMDAGFISRPVAEALGKAVRPRAADPNTKSLVLARKALAGIK